MAKMREIMKRNFRLACETLENRQYSCHETDLAINRPHRTGTSYLSAHGVLGEEKYAEGEEEYVWVCDRLTAPSLSHGIPTCVFSWHSPITKAFWGCLRSVS